ncbi:helix-turn-helix domain-containing protein [Pseudohaliea sp.]|uniref:winged helix-turn-helix transcriptional regulator n=1 Tax=Pseudohaliea sp. TaxID=2740289 RepID=UPI0032ECA92E
MVRKKSSTAANAGDEGTTAAARSEESEGNTEAEAALEAGFCPVGQALEVIGARWTLVLVRHLLTGTRGFQELRDLTGITPRLLSVRLSQLHERGLVEKVPVGNRYHYALTDLGRTLEPIVREVALWWIHHAMPEYGPRSEASAEAMLEALSYLLQKGGSAGNKETSYDLRLTVKENGNWRVEVSDYQTSGSSQGQSPGDAKQRDADGQRRAPQAAGAGGSSKSGASEGKSSLAWHPKPYRRGGA